jgi:molecular chaperone DnaK
MAYPIGIDLGTTNSAVSIWQDDRAQTIVIDGQPTLPSSIYIVSDGRMITGLAAKKRAMQNPGRYLTSIKRYLGEDELYWNIIDRTYTPVEIASKILMRLKQDAEAFSGGDPISEAILTIPACFNPNQKRGLRLAAELAGLKVLKIVPESIAAAISYSFRHPKAQRILVYDLGGGSFDVTILDVNYPQFHIVATAGDAQLGGEEFDLPLIQYLVDRLSTKTPFDLEPLRQRCQAEAIAPQPDLSALPLDTLVTWQRLREAAIEAKFELCHSPKARIYLPNILGISLTEDISLATYNRLIQPLVDRTVAKTHHVLQRAQLTPDTINQILLVGGMTRHALIKEQLVTCFQESLILEQPEDGIALGAAIVAADLVSRQYNIPDHYLKTMNLIL